MKDHRVKKSAMLRARSSRVPAALIAVVAVVMAVVPTLAAPRPVAAEPLHVRPAASLLAFAGEWLWWSMGGGPAPGRLSGISSPRHREGNRSANTSGVRLLAAPASAAATSSSSGGSAGAGGGSGSVSGSSAWTIDPNGPK
jgi:hypothetical protein